jgi:hypothetical protein
MGPQGKSKIERLAVDTQIYWQKNAPHETLPVKLYENI